MISNLPQRIIKYLEFAGFSGDRVGYIHSNKYFKSSFKDFGLNELEKSATSNGLRALFSSLFLLLYHTIVIHIFGNGDGDLEKCHMLVERYLKLFPNVSITLNSCIR